MPAPTSPVSHYGVLDSTIRSHYHVLYETQRLCGKSENTRRLMRGALNRFDAFLHRPALLTDLNDATLAAFLAALAREVRPATVNNIRSKIVALWSFLARKSIVPNWPTVPPVTEPEIVPIAWSDAEMRCLWAASGRVAGAIGGIPAAGWLRALHSLIYDTGERISAVMSLRLADIDLAGGWVNYRARTRKGGRKANLTRVHAETVAAIAAIWLPQRELLLPWPHHLNYLYGWYARAVLIPAGLPADRLHKFHCLRRTSATRIEALGGDATKMLGHSDRRVTVKYYLDPRQIPQQFACDLLPRIDPAASEIAPPKSRRKRR